MITRELIELWDKLNFPVLSVQRIHSNISKVIVESRGETNIDAPDDSEKETDCKTSDDDDEFVPETEVKKIKYQKTRCAVNPMTKYKVV